MVDEVGWRDTLPSEGVSSRDDTRSGVALSSDSSAVLLPALTEEEVARSTVTRGKKMVRIRPPQGVTAWEFSQVISAAFLCYMREGRTCSTNVVAEVIQQIPEKRVEVIMYAPEFRRAMLIRGVDYSGQSRMTQQQDMAIMIMSAPDGLTFTQKLKKAKVAPSTWRAWLKNKAFREVWDRVGGTLLTDHETDMMVALTGEALKGDVGAIKYAFEVSGRHNPAKQQAIDAEVLMAKLIEVIQEEVTDPEILGRIASRMSLIAGTQPSRRVIEG